MTTHLVVDGICQHLDMPAAMCADCRGHRSIEEQIAAEKTARPAEVRMTDGPPFVATYGGECAHCGDSFPEGTVIYWSALDQGYAIEEHRE